MDSFEATKVVYNRILKSEPELVQKIMGYILKQDLAEVEMIRLALGPDNWIDNIIQRAKTYLGLAISKVVSPPISPSMNSVPISDLPLQFTPFSPASSKRFMFPISPRSFWGPPPYLDHQFEQKWMHNANVIPVACTDSFSGEYLFQNQAQFIGLEDQMEPANPNMASVPSKYHYPKSGLSNLSIIPNRQSLSRAAFQLKACHYHKKGFCKHGNDCRYFHGQSFPDTFPRVLSPNVIESANKDQLLSPLSFEKLKLVSPGSLEKLELEIAEILKTRGGKPVSIASLGTIYYEKYGRSLEAEGYHTETHRRRGKAGYSLTQLLALLKNSIKVIDRPHGQHLVMLAEDEWKYIGSRFERNDPGPMISGPGQIYLTFPAESTFTKEDVSNYFKTFGPVLKVRFPSHEKRMYGFVTFFDAKTAKTILSKGNPHFVGGDRVLVKPYRDNPKSFDRKYAEKFEHPYYRHVNMDSELQAMPRKGNSSIVIRSWQAEEHEQTLELERMRFSELQLTQKPPLNQSYFGHSMDELKVPDRSVEYIACMNNNHSTFPSAERFNYVMSVRGTDTATDDNLKHTGTNNIDQEKDQGHDFPDSPSGDSTSEATLQNRFSNQK